MTQPEDWQKTFDSVHSPPGSTKQQPAKKTPQALKEEAERVRKRYASDIAVGLGAVDTGEDFDPYSALADYSGGVEGGIQGTRDSLVNRILGLFGINWGGDDVDDALADQAATVAAMNATVQALIANQAKNSRGGKSYVVEFGSRANSTSMGVDFTQYYVGAGTSTLGVVSGRCQFNPVNDDSRRCFAVFDGETASDDQVVGGAFASVPADLFLDPANYLIARSNADAASCVFLKLERKLATLACIVGGTTTVFTTRSIQFKPNALYWLYCGTAGGDRVFVVYEGSAPIITYTDTLEISELGDGFRGGGYGAFIGATGVGHEAPASLVAWTLVDNAFGVTIGSHASVFRASTGDTSSGGTGDQVFADTFDTVERISGDITFSGGNRFTVSVDGPYLLTVQANNNNGIVAAQTVQFLLYVNGTLTQRGPQKRWDSSSVRTFSHTFQVYLEAGDYIEPGHNFPVNPVWDGDAAGRRTRMSLTRGWAPEPLVTEG